jgi:hypothetical protein
MVRRRSSRNKNNQGQIVSPRLLYPETHQKEEQVFSLRDVTAITERAML